MTLYLSLLFLFWFIMMERIYKETIMIKTNLLNSRNIIVFCLIFLLLCLFNILINILFKIDPGFHFNTKYPQLYKIYIFVCAIVLLFFLGLIIISTIKILKNWNKIIPRHRFFFVFTFYFIMILFLFLVVLFYDFNNQNNGINYLLIFVLNNYYISML